MKKISLIVCGILVAVICISASADHKLNSLHSLEGVWELQHQFIYENNEVQDTLYNLDGYRQVKMYSRGKVMWSRFNPVDSDEWFGYGTYNLNGEYLEEQLEYASNSMMKIVDTVQVFRFLLEIDDHYYSQINLDSDGNRYVSENYKRIE
ncbi:MAG: hypothetical protein HKN48_05865 [Flavobacteriaceae bacterium]|nr:hypothetical protein [Flavobacteriaceae bacterium]